MKIFTALCREMKSNYHFTEYSRGSGEKAANRQSEKVIKRSADTMSSCLVSQHTHHVTL